MITLAPRVWGVRRGKYSGLVTAKWPPSPGVGDTLECCPNTDPSAGIGSILHLAFPGGLPESAYFLQDFHLRLRGAGSQRRCLLTPSCTFPVCTSPANILESAGCRGLSTGERGEIKTDGLQGQCSRHTSFPSCRVALRFLVSQTRLREPGRASG